ncbi:alpha/beta hydrolase [Antrihabitans sp. YC3-6]|uniref:Alpha/beta hydrolase n=1 Tax=Antrihabitans stalagmiti TaxID=2799499 RepID=A0A934NRH8_9NOCA|nr:alpha/beta hydrolase [Antrihabitans stalagmiti]MBJ8339970.1 alpha/beta hydrolase [Antrihabitans stalagmiti]
MLNRLLEALLYFPSRVILTTPADVDLVYTDLRFVTEDGVTVNGWWLPTPIAPSRGHILFAHGNGANIGDWILPAALLVAAGFDVMLFDYRGYGHSEGRPTEKGTYFDARAARTALLEQDEVDPDRVLYLGESLGGAVMIELATAYPPAGLILTSTFTSVRDVAKVHFGFIPTRLVPDAYPSLRRIRTLRSPLLMVHGTLDEIVPVSHAHRLFAAAPEPKELHIIERVGHNSLIPEAGTEWVETISAWVTGLGDN